MRSIPATTRTPLPPPACPRPAAHVGILATTCLDDVISVGVGDAVHRIADSPSGASRG
ncbi:hypothetical protein MXD62_26350 [Frankia sp. Mgl5]|uniref:hypothetical protein n=1 Tax=Frankia sp. Mgl5 TaxID=2933793 RepID=UPI00200FD5D0|nr:hypothetical protein [Frankia sp. Mgl5]MCK9930638.1 hypothetical protein [Frankia sp. Mgl5]